METETKKYGFWKWWFGHQYFPPNYVIVLMSIGVIVSFLKNDFNILVYYIFGISTIYVLNSVFQRVDKDNQEG